MTTTTRLMRPSCGFALACLLLALPAMAQTERPNPRPGQPGHEDHEEWQGDFPTPASLQGFKVVNTVPLPDGFLGNMATDPETSRVWLVSVGPPTNETGPSMLYEIDPSTGAVLAQAEMPFEGDISSPIYVDGYLYQGVFHESKMYKIELGEHGKFGDVVGSIDLPTINDLNLVDEAHPMPFIEFGGVTLSPDGNFVIHADDVGEFITVDRETGEILERTRTLKALGGILGATRSDGQFLVVANSDPRGGYCALSYPPALSRAPGQKDISWALLDGKSGQVLASLRNENSPAYASGIALLNYEETEGAPYGRFAFLATGETGLLTLEWTPLHDSF